MEKNSSVKLVPHAKRPPQEIIEQLYELLQFKRHSSAATPADFSDRLFTTTLEKQERDLYAELRASLAPPRRKGKRRSAG